MRRRPALACCLLAAALALLLPACSLFSQREVTEERPDESTSAAEAAASLGNPLLASTGELGAVNYNVSTEEELKNIDNGAEGEVYFTNPDNPDEEIEGITAAFENRRQGNGWLDDYDAGVRLARRENRPLLIWFHDSIVSPKSRQLGTQLLDTPDFGDWCKDRVVRVKLDAGASIDEQSEVKARYSRRSINAMASRFGLKQKPALAVISPNGKVTVTIDGFDGFVSGVELELKAGVQQAEKEFEKHKQELAGRGYRTWHSAKGNKELFARLQRFDEARGVIYLREAGGRVSSAKLGRFSQEDRDYIAERAREAAERKKGGGKP